MKKLVVGITGASGAPYAKRLLDVLARVRREQGGLELAVCLSSTAPEVWALECGGDVREHVRSLDVPCWGLRDYKAPFASGSAGWSAMIVVPCSMSTVARIAHGISDTLLTRAADVMLKERRPLVVVPREMPLSVIHLENLTALARAGGIILPAMPSFYAQPTSVNALVDTVVGRLLDQVGLEHGLLKRWGSDAEAEQKSS
jgi:4-hydroxy-3-polyprenylbenzoate decarboxylase